MNIVLLAHPEFLGWRSQDQFACMLQAGYRARGHTVSLRRPQARVHRLFTPGPLAKWAGYVDQYVLFPRQMRQAMRADPPDTVYVFCDQALGPWVPLAVARPHVVHCHDFLALRSALGIEAENPVSHTGRLYQRWIREGFRRARHFISISERTRQDLRQFGGVEPLSSDVVYNGLPYRFAPLSAEEALARIGAAEMPAEPRGMLLHVSGGQWYKNTAGVVYLYAEYARATGSEVLPLWIVGPAPGAATRAALAEVPGHGQVRFFQNLQIGVLQALYSHARAFLFPSLAEGFGWPIAEALASGCPVITTGEAPMTEVGGDAAHYIPRLASEDDVRAWAGKGARALVAVLDAPPDVAARRRSAGFAQVAKFDADTAIDRYLEIYARILRGAAARADGNGAR